MILIISGSFIFDNIISLCINKNSLFFPLFTLLSLIIIFSYNLKDYNYFLLCFGIGLLYDVVFTDTLFLNSSIFLFFSLCIYLIFKKINYNLFNIILVSLLLIFVYRIITYILFLLSFKAHFNLFTLLSGVYSSIIINIVYIGVIYFIRKKITNSSK